MTVCDREGWSKIIKNSVTYFMDDSLSVKLYINQNTLAFLKLLGAASDQHWGRP